MASPAAPADGRAPVCRTGDPAELARAFAVRLAGVGGMRRALAAWALGRDTLEGTLVKQRVEEGACHKGCAWCCRLEVEIGVAEAAHLARRAQADPELEARLRANAARVAGLGEVARFRAAIPCAFLDLENGACRVYEDRPLACRSYRSRDADWCRSIMGAPSAPRVTPLIREGIGIRALIQRAVQEVTPPEHRARGELHALTLRVLDAVTGSGRNR